MQIVFETFLEKLSENADETDFRDAMAGAAPSAAGPGSSCGAIRHSGMIWPLHWSGPNGWNTGHRSTLLRRASTWRARRSVSRTPLGVTKPYFCNGCGHSNVSTVLRRTGDCQKPCFCRKRAVAASASPAGARRFASGGFAPGNRRSADRQTAGPGRLERSSRPSARPHPPRHSPWSCADEWRVQGVRCLSATERIAHFVSWRTNPCNQS